MKRRDVLAATFIASTTMAGCIGNDSSGPDNDTSNAGNSTVTVSERGYEPRQLSIDIGATVTWENENSTLFPRHTVTSKPLFDEATEWDFDEELAEEGDEVSYTFEEEGLYTYVGTDKGEDCMCGVIEVGDVSYDEPLPCSPAAGGGC